MTGPDGDELPFAAAAHERLANERLQPDWWERTAADPNTRVLAVGDGLVATEERGLRLLSVAEAERLTAEAGENAERMLLGAMPAGPVLAVSLPDVPESLRPRPVRAVAPGLDATRVGCSCTRWDWPTGTAATTSARAVAHRAAPTRLDTYAVAPPAGRCISLAPIQR